MKRRNFFTTAGMLMIPGSFEFLSNSCKPRQQPKIRLSETGLRVEKEPLISPFGFKGGYLSELWQVATYLNSENGHHAIGLGTQSVLWSDAGIFGAYPETEGNRLMVALTRKALEMIKGESFVFPLELTEAIFPEILAYGQKITGKVNLRKTFALNALVSVDNALWLLYAKENGFSDFDSIIPDIYKPAFREKHQKIAAIPLFSYNTTPEQIRENAEAGYFFMKIKIGQPGSQEEMLQKDMDRLTAIHHALKDIRTVHTRTGRLPYYFDANGRYEKKETLFKLLDHARKIGAFDQITLIEEPFPEEMDTDVADIPVRLCADESAHTETDTIQRFQMGYRAVALKPIAKTLSVTMKIAKAAADSNIPSFCADLTVNPVLVEWNKNVAARLQPFPGLENIGLLESNGHQNYKNWDLMKSYSPQHNKPWVNPRDGLYITDRDFFANGGGIFEPVAHYEELFRTL